jgi:hypothetical protein
MDLYTFYMYNLVEADLIFANRSLSPRKRLWKKEQTDLAGLARLRWVEKWRYERLADHFGVGRMSIWSFLGQVRYNPKNAALAKRSGVHLLVL